MDQVKNNEISQLVGPQLGEKIYWNSYVCVHVYMGGMKAGIYNCFILCFVIIEAFLMILRFVSRRFFFPDGFF